MTEIITGLLVAFITLYFFEGKVEVRERTHRLLSKIIVAVRTWHAHTADWKAREPAFTSGNESLQPNLCRETRLLGVTCTLGVGEEERGARGLEWYPFEAQDGNCELATLGFRNSGRTTNNATGQHYLYFRFDRTLASHFRSRLIYIIVEYHDSAPAPGDTEPKYLVLGYDSTAGDDIASTFKTVTEIPLLGDNSWKEAVFSLHDGMFRNRANGSDFRVHLSNVNRAMRQELVVRRVTAVVVE